MLQFWVSKIFEVVLALLAFSVIRHFVRRFYPESYELVLDVIVLAVMIIAIAVTWKITARDAEEDNFNHLVEQAYSDSRKAVDELQVIGENPKHRFHNQARGIVESLSGSTITLPSDDMLVNKLQELEYAEILHYYRQTPQVHGFSVIFGVDGNKRITEEEKTDFMAMVIRADLSFRVAQRACFLIKPWLARYQQVNPVGHDEILRKCRVYGKIWRY